MSARDFGDVVRTVELWSSRLPPGAGAAHARISDALAHLGAARYGRDRRPPLESQWSDAVAALRATRRERLAAPAIGRARHWPRPPFAAHCRLSILEW